MSSITVESFKFEGANFHELLVFYLIRGDVVSWVRQFSVSIRKNNLSNFCCC